MSEPRTNQEVFDYVLEKLYEQGRPSVNPRSPKECLYRGDAGARCAAGWLLPDDLWKQRYNAYGFAALPAEIMDDPRMCHLDVDLVVAMQDAHDDAAVACAKDARQGDWLRDWLRKMQGVARNFNLQYRDPTPSTPAGGSEEP